MDDKSGLNRRRPIKRMSSPELWEARQLIASGVLKVEDYPNFDPENDGVLAYEEEAEEEFDIEINEEEAPFLAGQTDAALGDISPIKIVKNPDGSMQRAAMTQGALAKERREMKETQKRAAMDEGVPENLNQAWLDPMAAQDDRKLVADVRDKHSPRGYARMEETIRRKSRAVWFCTKGVHSRTETVVAYFQIA